MKRTQDGTSSVDDDGFTLIELLVVIIIIGILAAIAIPVFLNQRNKGYDATVKSDLTNAAIAEETVLTNDDAYTSDIASGGVLRLAGFKPSANVALTVVALRGTGGADSFCLRAANTKGGSTWWWDSAAGGLTTTACS